MNSLIDVQLFQKKIIGSFQVLVFVSFVFITNTIIMYMYCNLMFIPYKASNSFSRKKFVTNVVTTSMFLDELELPEQQNALLVQEA